MQIITIFGHQFKFPITYYHTVLSYVNIRSNLGSIHYTFLSYHYMVAHMQREESNSTKNKMCRLDKHSSLLLKTHSYLFSKDNTKLSMNELW